MANTLYTITMSRRLQRSAEEAFHVVEDLERFPEFMPNVVSVRILEEDGNRKVAEWDTRIDDAPLTWIEEGIYDVSLRTVRFRSIEGVFDRFDGYWQVVPERDGCNIRFELVYEIGLPEIEEFVGPILRERLIENVDRMLNAIELRVER